MAETVKYIPSLEATWISNVESYTRFRISLHRVIIPIATIYRNRSLPILSIVSPAIAEHLSRRYRDGLAPIVNRSSTRRDRHNIAIFIHILKVVPRQEMRDSRKLRAVSLAVIV